MISNMLTERRITLEGFAKSIQQLHNMMLIGWRALKNGYSQTMAKIDALILNQKALEVPKKPRCR